MRTLKDKISNSRQVIGDAIAKYKRIAVACSFGKDSMVTVHLARSVEPKMPVFSVMTVYKPKETLEYLVDMNKKMNLDVSVYMVADDVPDVFKRDNIKTVLLPTREFGEYSSDVRKETGLNIYEINPDECCRLLKVEPIKYAIQEMQLEVWISGLRNTEGHTREFLKEIEEDKDPVKINPILQFTELDVWKYLAMYNIPVNPLYREGYRSLGCAPCTIIVDENDLERAGRWQGTSKCGGECGIHTKNLKA